MVKIPSRRKQIVALASLYTLPGSNWLTEVKQGIPIDAKSLLDWNCLRVLSVKPRKAEEMDYELCTENGTTQFELSLLSPVSSFFSCCAIVDGIDDPKTALIKRLVIVQ